MGHAFSALFAWELARKSSGRFLLRLEDIDGDRCRAEYVAGIEEDLRWLGIEWETPVLVQSTRAAAYQSALDQLRELGVLYPCFCTRRDIQAEIARAGQAPQGPDGPLYPGLCRHLSPDEAAQRIASGESHAWRLDVMKAMILARQIAGGELYWEDAGLGRIKAEPELLGDVVLARKDALASYHLAVVVDDAFQGVTLVTRGSDLIPSTHVHRLLQTLLDLPVPRWHHHRLITDENGVRLAKRDNARSLLSLRQSGVIELRIENGELKMRKA